jgi:hypothetical protein
MARTLMIRRFPFLLGALSPIIGENVNEINEGESHAEYLRSPYYIEVAEEEGD